MTQIMSHRIYAWDSFERMTWFEGLHSLKNVGRLTQASQLIHFTPWLSMSQTGYVTHGDESPVLGLREDTYIRGLVPTKR